MSYHSYGEWCSERSNFVGVYQWDYKLVGRLEQFQDEKYTFLQNEDDIIELVNHFGFEDEFRNYMIVTENGEYTQVFGVMGIHLSDLVYEYVLP